MDFKPREYQRQIIEHIIDCERAGVFAGMGMGKTASVLAALDGLKAVDRETTFPVLVVAPLQVCMSVWPAEIAKWTRFHGLSFRQIVGNEQTRLAALSGKVADIYIINYENLIWLVEIFKKKGWPFKTVITDESTRIKGFRLRNGTKRAAALARTVDATRRWVIMTGTPTPRNLIDIWGQVWFLDKGDRLGHTFKAFTSRWFDYDPYTNSYTPTPWGKRQIPEKLKDICITVQPEDFFDLDQLIVTDHEIEFTDALRRQYSALERQLYLELTKNETITAVTAAAKTIKLLQFCSGAVYIDDTGNNQSEYSEIHNLKLDMLESVVEETDTPVLVAVQYRHDFERILNRFPQARRLDKNPATLEDWNRGRIPMLLAHPASAGHGLNLQDGGRHIVFFSHWWNAEERLQIIERIGPVRQLQSGHPRPVFVHNIIIKNSVEETVIQSHNKKVEIQQALMERLKRYVSL